MAGTIRIVGALILLVLILLLAACQSPDEYALEDEPSATGTLADATHTPTNPPPEATPTPTSAPPPPATPTIEILPTATPEPLEPTPTQAPASTNTPAPAPTPTAPASAADVWNLRQFETDEPVMVLTFDAGADAGFAAEILDFLADEGLHASFGMTGSWAEDHPELVQRMVDEGHHLINHSWSHPHFPELATEERVQELHAVENLIRDLTGVELQPYFRPPFGEYDEPTLTDLARNGYTINVMWTIDSLGWKGLTADEITSRVLDGAAPGAIVLMHVGSQSQDAAALPEMIRLLREQGYSFATVADLVE